MRLSYDFEIDTENKLRIFHDLLTQNQVEFDENTGNIYLDTTEQNVCNSVFHLSQVIAKVSRLDVLKREVVSGLFFEMVNQFIESELLEFNPHFGVIPLPGRDDLEITCAFEIAPSPVYLIAIRNSAQARLAALSFLEFQRHNLRYKGCVVHEDMDKLPAKDRKRVTSAADKQFTSIEDFRDKVAEYLSRERVA